MRQRLLPDSTRFSRVVGRRARRFFRPIVVGPVAIGVAVLVVVPTTLAAKSARVHITGVQSGMVLGKAQLAALAVKIAVPDGDLERASVKIDDRAMHASRAGGLLVVRPGPLADGSHTLSVSVARHFLTGGASASRTFRVDTTPPVVNLTAPKMVQGLAQPLTITGTVSGHATVTAAGGTVVQSAGGFTVRYPTPPASAVVVAKDEAGNTATASVSVPVRYPNQIRALHETGRSWGYDRDRNEALALARAHKINAVEIDVKDEDGIVNFPADVPLAKQLGATRNFYDAAAVVKQLHSLGVRVIGRVVAFRDPTLASWAWSHGHHDWVIQTPGGQPWGGSSAYGGASFTNFANPAVRAYNIAVAEAAAKVGFDDIVFDYIRRPDGAFASMSIPGIAHSDEAATQGIDAFAAQARAALRPLGSFTGAAIFAQAVNDPQATAQRVPDLARALDFVMPMDYPSHWLHGEYGVADPNAGPSATYAIVHRSLLDWAKAVKGSDSEVVPWLQAEDYPSTYTPAMVAAQIKGAADAGMPGFILWNANAYYANWEAALTPDAANVLPR